MLSAVTLLLVTDRGWCGGKWQTEGAGLADWTGSCCPLSLCHVSWPLSLGLSKSGPGPPTTTLTPPACLWSGVIIQTLYST